MKKTKKMFAECYYLLKGGSTARDLFFEDNQDIIDFRDQLESMLGCYIKVQKFHFYRDQWALAVKLNSKEEIIRQYKKDRDRSKKANRSNDYTEVWRIISERMRLFLSNYVRKTNFRKGRKGSKVDMTYERYCFTDVQELEAEITKWKARTVESRQEKKYRYLEKHYSVDEREKGIRMMIFCGIEDGEEFCSKYKGEIWSLITESIDVVRHWITDTLKLHIRPD